MNKQRLQKLESVSHEVLSQIIAEHTRDIQSDFGLINVTDVKVSSDLSYIDVYVSAIKNPETLTKTLAKLNYLIQGEYNRKIAIRKLPKIRYRLDKSGETSSHILETLQKIQSNEKK